MQIHHAWKRKRVKDSSSAIVLKEEDLENASFCERCIEGTAICASAALVAILVSDLNLSLSLAGVTYGYFIMFFLPSVIYYRAASRIAKHNLSEYDRFLKWMAILSVIYGTIVSIAGFVSIVLGM